MLTIIPPTPLSAKVIKMGHLYKLDAVLLLRTPVGFQKEKNRPSKFPINLPLFNGGRKFSEYKAVRLPRSGSKNSKSYLHKLSLSKEVEFGETTVHTR